MLQQLYTFFTNDQPDVLRGNNDFRKLGQQLIEKYPAIKRPGKHSWSVLTRALSGRLRTFRWEKYELFFYCWSKGLRNSDIMFQTIKNNTGTMPKNRAKPQAIHHHPMRVLQVLHQFCHLLRQRPVDPWSCRLFQWPKARRRITTMLSRRSKRSPPRNLPMRLIWKGSSR